MYKKITKVKKVKEYSDVPFDDDDDDLYKIKFDNDYICTDVPLFIRLLEWAREEVSKDADLHIIAKKLVDACEKKENVLTMDDYAALMQ